MAQARFRLYRVRRRWFTSDNMAALSEILIREGVPFNFDGYSIEFICSEGSMAFLRREYPAIREIHFAKRQAES